MKDLTPETFGDILGLAAVIVALLIVAYYALESYCDSCPVMDPLTGEIEDQKEIAAEHVEKRMPSSKKKAGAIKCEVILSSRDFIPNGPNRGTATIKFDAEGSYVINPDIKAERAIREAQQRWDDDVQGQMMADTLRATSMKNAEPKKPGWYYPRGGEPWVQDAWERYATAAESEGGHHD